MAHSPLRLTATFGIKLKKENYCILAEFKYTYITTHLNAPLYIEKARCFFGFLTPSFFLHRFVLRVRERRGTSVASGSI